MSLPLEAYALIGDRWTAALVADNGSIDWLCLPRFDSGACFAALLGTEDHGRWIVTPVGDARPAGRRYRDDSLVLETDLESPEGRIRITDCMPRHHEHTDVIRLVRGITGSVRVRSEVVPRFDYGTTVPWLRQRVGRVHGVAGPDAVVIDGDVAHEIQHDRAVAEFTVSAGQTVALRMTWVGVSTRQPARMDLPAAVEETDRWWRDWSSQCTYRGPYREAVIRSLITLKALTYAPTGGIVAAVTTSLPEQLGGSRNWDYRYCWIRDATFTLMALLEAGYHEEAAAWREWLLRALAGRPEQMQIMYGVEGERRLTEVELDLPGYATSRPVRIGNAAHQQLQLDVYGELMDALHQARVAGQPADQDAWHVQRELMDFLESGWQQPDNGIWEVRGPRRDFVHSKVMAWAAVDRAVKAVEQFGLDGPVDRWRELRQDIHDEVCAKGYDSDRGSFTQYYGSPGLDAALLQLAPVGFLPASDQRIVGTIRAIEEQLMPDGFVQRYATTTAPETVDGLPPGEGVFLACSFWLADNYTLLGEHDEARELFERLLPLRNDVGLLAEEYDPITGRQVGNLPQAFSHVSLVNTAFALARDDGPPQKRSASGGTRSGAGRWVTPRAGAR